MRITFQIVLLFYVLFPLFLFAQNTRENVTINKFQPINKSDEDISNLISLKIEKEIAKLKYEINSISESDNQTALKKSKETGSKFLIGGYFGKNKYDNYELYSQIYDPEKDIIIDSVILSDSFSEIDGIDLDKQEVKEAVEKKIDQLVEKLTFRLRVNSKKKIQVDNLNELENSKLGQKQKFPYPKKDADTQTAEVFKILQENAINRQVEVASLFKEDELKVGSTVASVDETQWKKYGARKSVEAVGHLPSVMHNYTLGGAQATSIRGYTNNNSFSGVAKLIDGIPVNNFVQSSGVSNVSNFGLGSTNRIEMIRGPGSAIYGSDAFHGVYSIKAYESEKDMTEVYSEVGTLGFYSGFIRSSKGAYDNKLRVHVSATGQGQRDQQTPYTSNLYTLVPRVNYIQPPFNSYPGIYDMPGVNKNQYHNGTATAKIDYKPTENLTLRLGIYTTEWNGKDFPGTGPNVSLNRDTSYRDAKFYMTKFTTEYKFANDITIDGTVYGWQQNLNFATLLYIPAPFSELIGSANKSTEQRFGATVTAKQSKNSFNTQWIISSGFSQFQFPDTKLTFTSQNTLTGFRLDSALAIQNKLQWQTAPYESMKRTIKSSFFQTKTGFFKERVYLLLGGRYDMYSDFGNQFTPRGGFIFMLSEKTALKTLYGRAFRAPNAQDLTYNTAVLGNSKLKPETIDSYEVSIMHKEKNWKVNLITFENTWKNGIVRVLKSGLPQPFIAEAENKGINKSRGVELEFYFNNEKWDFLLAGSHVVSKDYTQPDLITFNESNFKIAQNPAFFTSQNPNGKRYTLFPRYIVSLGAGYTFDWNKLSIFIVNRFFSNYRDTTYANQNGTSRYIKNYSRFDITISLQPTESFECGLVVRNLSNRKNHIPGTFESSYGILDEELNASLRAGMKF